MLKLKSIWKRDGGESSKSIWKRDGVRVFGSEMVDGDESEYLED